MEGHKIVAKVFTKCCIHKELLVFQLPATILIGRQLHLTAQAGQLWACLWSRYMKNKARSN